jgi:type II secretory pathway pseudopilin PulG
MKAAPRDGFTLVEALVSSTLFIAIMGAFALSLVSAERARADAEVTERLHREALEALDGLREELSRSGFENGFPLAYDDDVAADYAVFAHATAHGANERCDLVYRLPADADADGWPDVEEDGSVVWEEEPRAFLLVPNDSGTNDLVRRSADGASVTVARNVATLRYSTPAETGFAIPLDCLRVEVGMSAIEDGRPYRFDVTTVVRLQNGGLAP